MLTCLGFEHTRIEYPVFCNALSPENRPHGLRNLPGKSQGQHCSVLHPVGQSLLLVRRRGAQKWPPAFPLFAGKVALLRAPTYT